MKRRRRVSQRILSLPLQERAIIALRAAVREVYRAAAREGRSLFIWSKSKKKVVELTATELRRRERRRRRK